MSIKEINSASRSNCKYLGYPESHTFYISKASNRLNIAFLDLSWALLNKVSFACGIYERFSKTEITYPRQKGETFEIQTETKIRKSTLPITSFRVTPKPTLKNMTTCKRASCICLISLNIMAYYYNSAARNYS